MRSATRDDAPALESPQPRSFLAHPASPRRPRRRLHSCAVWACRCAATATAFGHSLEPSFPANLALAAMALSRQRLFAPLEAARR